MTRLTKVELAWADGDYVFDIGPLGAIRELEEKCDAGAAVIFHRLASNAWKDADVRETIRVGLIGAGMSQADALKLVKTHIDGQPRTPHVSPALAILMAYQFGVGDDPNDDDVIEDDPTAGKAEAEVSSAATGDSPSPPSTAPPPQ